MIADLHAWHAKTDSEGVPVWYVRSSLEKAIDRLAIQLQKQTEASERQIEAIARIWEEIGRLKRESS